MWYEGLSVDKTNFKSLSHKFTGLIRELIVDQSYGVHVVGNHVAPASVNLDKRIITIDSDFFSGKHAIYGTLSWNKKLEFCAGVCVHEGAHIAYTPRNWIDLYLPEGKMPRTNFSFTVANVVEDIFIEAHAKLANSNFAYIIDFANSVMFSDEEVAKRRALWGGEKPETEEELANAINYMIAWKRRSVAWFFQTDYERTLYNLFVSADDAANPVLRGDIVQAILKLLLGEENCKKQAKKEDAIKLLVMKPDGEVVKTSFNEKPIEILKTNFDFVEERGGSTKDGFVTLAIKPTREYNNIDAVNFSGFSKIIQARNSQRAIKGLPSTKGKKIRNLSHYNGGKIFGEMEIDGDRVGRGKQDVVVLIDLSGSMRGNVFGQSKRKITFALECAAGLAKTFDKEGFNYAILGHTVGWVPGEDIYCSHKYSNMVNLFKFKGLNEKKNVKSVVNSLGWMDYVFCGNGNNDSYAIFLAAKEFVPQNDKILIVISDGQPVESSTEKLSMCGVKCFGGAYEDTKSVIEYLRKNRVNVFALAIDKDAVKDCQYLYGENFTATAFNPQDFVKAVIKFTE